MLPVKRPPLHWKRNVWIVLVCVNAAAATSEIWEYHAGKINSTAALLSNAIALVILNLVVLWLVFARSKREGWPIQRKKLSLAAGAMAVTALLFTAVGVSLVKQRNDFFDLAMSNRPLSSIKPERTRLVVEYIRRDAADSQEENKVMAGAKPMSPEVYSPESFANQAVMHSTVALVKTYVQIDSKFFAKLQAAREDFHRKMAACDPEFLKSWDAARANYWETGESANRLEHDWFTSINALYSYGEQHAPQIEVKEGKISIADPTVHQKFDDLLDRSKALHEKLESVVEEEAKQQKQARARIE